MAAPEVAVFDLGKVLIDFDYGIAARRISAHGNLDPAAVQRYIDQSPLLCRYETGALNQEQFFDEVRRETGFRGGLDMFAEFFADVFSPIEPMIELHGALRAAGVPTFIFSNTNDLAVAHIRKKFPFFARFEGHVLSYEHGAMKPDARLYDVVEKVTGRRGGAIVYLDDRLENVEAGRQRGWEVIHHQAPESSIARVRELGLLKPDRSGP